MRNKPDDTPHIVIAGAGAIGCFVGGMLAHAGQPVSFLGRARIFEELRAHGLRLTDFGGLDISVPPEALDLHEQPEVLARADIILVCVKSSATTEMAELIAAHARLDATVVSLQNGLGHADTLRSALPAHDIRPAMVPFNVVPMGDGQYHRATSGDIVIGAGPRAIDHIISVTGLDMSHSAEIEAIQWGKFLLNLNNAINALSGLNLHAQLLDRGWRRLMADQMAEALYVLRVHGCPIRSTTPIPVGLVPHILRLPTPLFRRIAAKMLTIDPTARTSMAYDLDAGRGTEVDALQGRIVEMGRQKSIVTPLCSSLLAAVKIAEKDGLTPRTVESLRN